MNDKSSEYNIMVPQTPFAGHCWASTGSTFSRAEGSACSKALAQSSTPDLPSPVKYQLFCAGRHDRDRCCASCHGGVCTRHAEAPNPAGAQSHACQGHKVGTAIALQLHPCSGLVLVDDCINGSCSRAQYDGLHAWVNAFVHSKKGFTLLDVCTICLGEHCLAALFNPLALTHKVLSGNRKSW